MTSDMENISNGQTGCEAISETEGNVRRHEGWTASELNKSEAKILISATLKLLNPASFMSTDNKIRFKIFYHNS